MSKPIINLPPRYSNEKNLSPEELEMLNYYKEIASRIEGEQVELGFTHKEYEIVFLELDKEKDV